MTEDGNHSSEQDAVVFINALLADATAAGASDIYWIPCRDVCRIRIRVNGLQQDFKTVPNGAFANRCAARIKVLAGMLTYRSKTSQDGAIRGVAMTADTEFRVAAMPTLHGERMTLRILGQATGGGGLDDLGFQDDIRDALRAMLAPPNGLIILTGPTGCGKTTTIYALIKELIRQNQDPSSIITIEDPVEKVMPDISQVSLQHGDGTWHYEQALVAALRQDVKTLVIGEIRDVAVAKVVLNAALSGHRVITTLHAGDIPAVYARLLHQGFEAFLIASAITGVVTQRLVTAPDGRARVPVGAALVPDDAWRDSVAARPSLSELRARIKAYPLADIHAAARRLVSAGRLQTKDALLL